MRKLVRVRGQVVGVVGEPGVGNARCDAEPRLDEHHAPVITSASVGTARLPNDAA
jgi:hypothetical protein